MVRRPPQLALFPYTTLFRSAPGHVRRHADDVRLGQGAFAGDAPCPRRTSDRKSTRLNSSHQISTYADFRVKQKTSKTKVAGRKAEEVAGKSAANQFPARVGE